MVSITPNRDAEVTIVQQGKLNIDNGVSAISGTGDTNLDFVVPVGKKWILKHIETYNAGFVGTLNHNYHQIVLLAGGNLSLYDGGSSLSTSEKYGEQSYQLEAGDIVRVKFGVTAYTSDQIGSNILYMEFDK